MPCPHGVRACSTCENSDVAKELRALRARVTELRTAIVEALDMLVNTADPSAVDAMSTLQAVVHDGIPAPDFVSTDEPSLVFSQDRPGAKPAPRVSVRFRLREVAKGKLDADREAEALVAEIAALVEWAREAGPVRVPSSLPKNGTPA